jgi:hypothetical protein
MLVLAITGLFGASLGGASLPPPERFDANAVESRIADQVTAQAAPDLSPTLHLVANALFDPVPQVHADALGGLAHRTSLPPSLSGVACYLSRTRGTGFTPTSKAPRPPTLFLTVTLGTCPG